VAVNCAAIPDELLEAELFGVAARVATGVDPRPGRFQQAEGGVLLLDEIGELPEKLQAKLLRVLQEREVLPLGGAAARRIDVRVIAMTNRDLGRLAAEGGFRADLYFRLRGLELRVPPLRERREDIPELVLAFATAAARQAGKRILGVSRRALELLQSYAWPGNIRELENEVRRAVLLCSSGALLESGDFADVRDAVAKLRAAAHPARAADAGPALPASTAAAAGASLRERVDAVERQAIRDALARCGGDKSKAARELQISRNGLSLKLKRLGIG
jgi:two-component system response regulator HupR/HoxA